MEVEILKGSSPRLDEIKKLWRAHAATLGFFPDGAFQEYASKGCILVASDPLGQLAGYLLFRKSAERLAIVHLCVREDMVRRGVAKALVDALLDMSRSFQGINVLCRRDFSASSLWPKLGFIAVQEKPGRGAKNTVLTNWWLDRGTPDLFSSQEQVNAEEKLKIVIDANVFYDLDNPVASDTEESKALQADWLQSSVELQITPETLNEIDRHNTSSHRLRNRKRTARFTVLRPQHDRFSSIERKVRTFFRVPLSESDASDVRQLAWAIASDRSIFVTRDENLLDLAPQLYREFAISLVRPSDLIIQLDELHERSKYQPARVAGTLVLQRLRKAPMDDLVRALQAAERKETKPKFRERFCKYLAAPQTCHCWGLFWEEERPAALFVYDRSNKEELLVPFLRITRGSEAFTILRNLLLRLVQDAATENRARIVITDPFCLAFVEQELESDGFNREGRHWVKHTIPSAMTAERFIEKHSSILELGGRGGEHEVMQSLSEIIRSDARTAQKLERVYWPLKIVDAPISNYIIPIQPRWAAELFDNELANQDLFGARTKLSLNREGVYYRSAMPTGGLTAPGRILWYVSDDKRYQGSKCIRACSFLEDVVVGRPKELFRRFDRLGVYEWKHLMELTKDKIDKNLMTIRYSDTQLMGNPIIWDTFQAVLQESGVRTQLQSPQQISPQVFAKLYRMGMGYKDNL